MKHIGYVDLIADPVRPGSLVLIWCRKGACTCGWRGPERATLGMASNDARVHELRHQPS